MESGSFHVFLLDKSKVFSHGRTAFVVLIAAVVIVCPFKFLGILSMVTKILNQKFYPPKPPVIGAEFKCCENFTPCRETTSERNLIEIRYVFSFSCKENFKHVCFAS